MSAEIIPFTSPATPAPTPPTVAELAALVNAADQLADAVAALIPPAYASRVVYWARMAERYHDEAQHFVAGAHRPADGGDHAASMATQYARWARVAAHAARRWATKYARATTTSEGSR